MKVYLDRESCPTWQGACESCFGWHLEQLMDGDFQPSACMVEWDDECRDEITFFMRDKEGKDRVLVVNQENWSDAYDSWSKLLEAQEKEQLTTN